MATDEVAAIPGEDWEPDPDESEAEAEAEAAAARDADLQQRADFVREALKVESSNRAMARVISLFLWGPDRPPVATYEPYQAPGSGEPDDKAEGARSAARVAAYERLVRIFRSDLPGQDMREAVERARWAAWGCIPDNGDSEENS